MLDVELDVEEWETLIEYAHGDWIERAHALVTATGHLDRVLKSRYPDVKDFKKRLRLAEQDCDLEDSYQVLSGAWDLRNAVAHDARIARAGAVIDVIVPLACASFSIGGSWDETIESRLRLCLDMAGAPETPSAVTITLDAAEEVLGPLAGSRNRVSCGIALLLAGAVVQTQLIERGADDPSFDTKADLKPQLIHAYEHWLLEEVPVLVHRAVHIRNAYAHDGDLPERATAPEVELLLDLAGELAPAVVTPHPPKSPRPPRPSSPEPVPSEPIPPTPPPQRPPPVRQPEQAWGRLPVLHAPMFTTDGRDFSEVVKDYWFVWFFVLLVPSAIAVLWRMWLQLVTDWHSQNFLNFLVHVVVDVIAAAVLLAIATVASLILSLAAATTTRLLTDGGAIHRCLGACSFGLLAVFVGAMWTPASTWLAVDAKPPASIEAPARHDTPPQRAQVRQPASRVDKACPQRAAYRASFGPIRRRVRDELTCRPGDLCGYPLFITSYPCSDGGDLAATKFRERLSSVGCPDGQAVVFDDANCTRSVGVIFRSEADKDLCRRLAQGQGSMAVMAMGYSVMRDLGGSCE